MPAYSASIFDVYGKGYLIEKWKYILKTAGIKIIWLTWDNTFAKLSLQIWENSKPFG